MVPLDPSYQYPLRVCFFQTEVGNQPVRAWLLDLAKEERKLIGEDIKTVQYRWPLGMPLVRYLTNQIYEIRTHLPNRIARTLFFIESNSIVLLHGFIKKTQQTPEADLELAQIRKRSYLIRP
jgi:phage-related protein